MSWSVNAVGTVPAVAVEVEKQFAGYHCAEPEESVRLAALALIGQALGAQSPDAVVRVMGAGSQSRVGDQVTNYLNLSVDPIPGFLG